MGPPNNNKGGLGGWTESGTPVTLGLPEVYSPELGRLGPAFGYGVGCGVGLGVGLMGGLGFGWGFPGIRYGVGFGAGCGLGIGYGYALGRGRSYDDRGSYTNVGPPKWRGGGNSRRSSGGGAGWRREITNSRFGRSSFGRMFLDLFGEVESAVNSITGSNSGRR